MFDALVRLLLLLALLGLVTALNLLRGSSGTSVTLAAGALMLCGIFAGKVAKGLRLPRLTGYLLVGILIGPFALNFIPSAGVRGLELVKGLAVSLIALAAGTELHLSLIKRVGRKVVIACVGIAGVVFVVCFGAVMLCRPLLPFMATLTLEQGLAVAAVISSVVVSFSPTVTIAMVQEMRAKGTFTEFLMAMVILGDLVVLLLFALSVGVARATLGAEFSVGLLFGGVGWEIFGSLALGLFVGVGVLVYMRRIGRELPLFLTAVCFVSAELGMGLHLSPLLIALAVGALIANLDPAQSNRMHGAIEHAGLPVFALFFAIAGADLHLDALLVVGPAAVILVVVRGASIVATCKKLLPAEDPRYRSLIWMGLISQAGVTFGLASIVARTFPGFGTAIQTLIVAMVTIHELIGPVLMRRALLRSGESHAESAA